VAPPSIVDLKGGPRVRPCHLEDRVSGIDPRTPEGVAHLATLSRLALDEGERASLAEHLGRMLDWVAALQQVDTSQVDPHASEHLAAALRDDVVRPSLDHEAALANAPRRTAEGFEVPRVVSE
jgi:aspartyl-tRNA(Asn)/glutamyl-tRNA(Gln) amidotransferase subunit C